MTEPASRPERTPLLRVGDATVRKGVNGDRPILDRISMEISLGEHTAILGPNGSGKSSLIRLITREYYPLARPDDGSAVEIFGRSRWDVFELRTLLGVVTPELDRDFTDLRTTRITGIDAVLSGFFATRGVQAFQDVTPSMRERAWEALSLMEATHLAAKPVHELSTGEVRRVLIARALVPDPPALLLDEPTAGLDIVVMQRFLEAIRRLAQTGKTILLVTHHLHEIIPEVQRVILLKGGKVLRDGAKAETLTTPNLSEAFSAPLRVEVNENGYYRVDLC